MSRWAKRRLVYNVASAYRKVCEVGNRELAHQLRDALVNEVTSLGHGKEDRHRNADDVVGALDRHRKHLEREAS